MDSSLIRFRVFGSADLCDTTGRELRSVLAQPKRVALLAYLALSARAGFQRRDTLLALLWPELDQERSRRALRQAVHFLRRTLGAAVLVGRGDDIGVAPTALSCDAWEFGDALDRSDPATALALYRGDLLSGFYAADASPEFDEWVARERDRLHQRAVEAAWWLSGSEEARGRATSAATWARWAAERAPDDERTQRRLVALLDRLGDRTGALRAYENLAEHARAEFDAEPSAETRALLHAIRSRDTVAVAQEERGPVAPDAAAPAGSDPSDAGAPIESDPSDTDAEVHVPAPSTPGPHAIRRAWTAAAAAVVLLLGGGFALRAALETRAESGIAAQDARAVADAPSRAPRGFVTTSSPAARRFFAAGLRALYDQGDFRTARALFLDALQEDSTFAMAAYYVARCDVGLDLPNDGWAMMQGAQRLAARATERERLLIALSWAMMTENPDRMALAESLATRYPEDTEGQLQLGGALVGIGDFLGAVPHLRRVIDSDSTAGPASSPWCEACDAFATLVEAYLQADSLGAAERVAREWVARRPRSAAPWNVLSGVLARERRVRDAVAAERKEAALDPSLDVAVDAAVIALHNDDPSSAARLLDTRMEYDANAAAATGLWWLVITRRTQGQLVMALQAARRLRAVTASTPEDQSGGIAEAQVLFEMGRFGEAAREFDSLAALGPPTQPRAPGSLARQRSWLLTHAATAYAAAGDSARLALLADSVEGFARQSAYGRDWTLPHYLRGLLWNARGDRTRALDEFRHAIFSPSDGYTRVNLELAQASLAAGEPQAAIATLRSALDGPVEASNYYLTRTEIHAALARSFSAAGERDSAAAHLRIVACNWADGDAPFRRRAAAAALAWTRLQRPPGHGIAGGAAACQPVIQ